MERNAILATVMVILILVGYQWYLSHETPAPVQEPPRAAKNTTEPPKASEPAAMQASTSPANPAAKKAYTPTAQTGIAPREITVDTPLMRVILTTAGARVKTWELKKYRQSTGAPVELVALPNHVTAPGPLSAWADPEQIDGIYEADKDKLDLSQPGSSGTITLKHVSTAGIQLQKQITFKADSYDVGVQVVAKNLDDKEAALQPKLAWGPGLRTSADKHHGTVQPPVLWLDDKRVHEDLTKLSKEKTIEGKVSWIALQDTYFTAALLPDQDGVNAFLNKGPEDQAIIGLEGPRKPVPSGGELALKAEVYAGPRDLDTLKAVGHSLDQMIDLGWFDFLARPALWLLKTVYHFTGNYGIAIILITILQKVVFYPLTYKSIKSMQAMQTLQPKVQALQERYKNNPQKKQEEMMALYKKQGVNPMGGCLPMIIQIPIFVALYNALSSSVEMWQAHFLWIRDLTQPDSLFTLALWGGQDYNVGNLLGLLMGVSMWIQQKMSPTGGDPRQAQMMLWMMPILFTFMFWNFPSGLVLYWFVNNLLQIGQQWLINRQGKKPQEPQPQPA
jgi:YidC/Oxa1 family membrane protein insertase